jgi:hypothetical protein
MLTKKVYDTIKQGLTQGVYKNVRLIKKNENGTSEVLITWAQVGKPDESLRRFEHIILLINKKLGAGNYVIECRTGEGRYSIKDSFEVTKKEPVQIQIVGGEKKEGLKDETIDKTLEQETMQQIDWDDYVKLIKEVEALKAEKAVLILQLEMANKVPVQPLNDGPKTTLDKVLSSLNDHIPTALSIVDKIISQRDKQLEIERQKLDMKQSKPTPLKNKFMTEQLVQELEGLYETDEEKFNQVLDELEQKDKKLYNTVCERLGLFEDTEDYEETYEDTESE